LAGGKLALKILDIRPDISIVLYDDLTHTITEKKVRSVGIRSLLTRPADEQQLAVGVRHTLDHA